jgi:hypothetical protein
MNLAAPVEHVDAFFDGDDCVAIEIGCALFELGEIFNRFQRPLGTEQPLYVHAA